MPKPPVNELAEEIPLEENLGYEAEPPMETFLSLGMSTPPAEAPVVDILSREDMECESAAEPPVETFHSMGISTEEPAADTPFKENSDYEPELSVEAMDNSKYLADKEQFQPNEIPNPVDSLPKVMLKKAEWKPNVKAPVESSPPKETPKSKVKAAVQKIEDKVLEMLK